MKKKREFTNDTIWWLDVAILNTNNTVFNYSFVNNIFFCKISYCFYFFFFLINRKNPNCLGIYNLDSSLIKYNNYFNYYIAVQTIFLDFKLLIQTKVKNYIDSISTVYAGNSWVERELQEFNKIQFLNLIDNRKLLLNYNYNLDLQYNNYNNIINDINL